MKQVLRAPLKIRYIFIIFLFALLLVILLGGIDLGIENFLKSYKHNLFVSLLLDIIRIFKMNQIFLGIFVLFIGFLAFYLNRNNIKAKDEIESNLEIENTKEQEAEEKRKEEFPEKFPAINKIPIMRSAFRWCYKVGFAYLAILLLILVMFTALKAPYFDISFFAGEHAMKYNTHVEPAKYMYERNNPFWMQKKYLAEPVNNPEGIFKRFGSPPIMEWGLLATYHLFPNYSMEFATRLFTHFIGILILFSGFVFFSQWLPKKAVLLITFLLAINPIINFTSFVTVLDSWLIFFTFLTLIYLSKYVKQRNVAPLYFAGLFFGIGISIKYSIFLWLAPITFTLLVCHSKKLATFLKDYGILMFLSLLPLIAFRTSLRNLPSDAITPIIIFLIWMIAFVVIFHLLKRYVENLENLAMRIVKNKLLSLTIITISLTAGAVFLYLTDLYKLSSEFLTDTTLVFNWDMYGHMLNEQFKPYMTENVYYLGLGGLLFTLFFGPKTQRVILFAFLAGSFVFWVLASKSIFFHNYYTNIIMITFAISVGTMFYSIGSMLRNRALLLVTMLLLGIFLFPAAYKASSERLSNEKDVNALKKVAQYLIANTKENEIYVDDSHLLTLTLMTGRSRTTEAGLIDQEIKESIKKIGFANTMKKYNISYVLTARDTPRYNRYANLFADQELATVSGRRSDLLQFRLNSNYDYFPDSSIRDEIIESENIEEKFVLQKEIDPFKIFGFQD